MGWLDDKVIAITGGESDLGAAVTRRCRDEGARVAVMDLMEHKVRKIQQELGEAALVVRGDVTKLADLQEFNESVIA